MGSEGRTVHLVVNRMAQKGGGLHQAVRDRASTLAENGVASEVWIDVLRFHSRLRHQVSQDKKSGRLHPDVRVRNVLSVLDDHGGRKDKRRPFRPPEDPDLVKVATKKGRVWQYVRDGKLELSILRDERGGVKQVDYFNRDGSQRSREEMNRSGRVERATDYASNGDAVEQRFYGRDGSVFLRVAMIPGTDDWGQSTLLGEVDSREFSNSGDLYRYAFERLLQAEEAPVLCSELRENRSNIPHQNVDDIVRSVEHPNVRKIAVAHSSHLLPPYRPGSRVSPNWQRLLDSLDDWDALAVWTEGQREELVERAGHADRIVAIPPVAPALPAVRRPVDPNRLVLVARIHAKKRVDEAMRVFHAVWQRNPEARLDVFGFGYGDDEERMVRALIDELGIAEMVHFKGFTKSVDEIYDGAVATIFTSASEGLGLALLESMSYKVPVVAYDSNYGPRDVISDGANGYLVPFGDHHAAADRVLELMASSELRAQVGLAARDSLKSFDLSSYLKGWTDVIEGRN